DSFLKDILCCLDRKNTGNLFPTTGEFVFKEAYSINSRLFLRLVSRTVKGVISGRGGAAKDVSEIGVEVSNSMAGGHAVRLSWFVFRLICASLRLAATRAALFIQVPRKASVNAYMLLGEASSPAWVEPNE